MDPFLVIVCIIILLFVIVIYNLDNCLCKKDVFSSVKIFVYFTVISTMPLIWFAFSTSSLNEIVFSAVSINYRDINLVREVYVWTFIGFLLTYFGLVVGNNASSSALNFFLNKIIGLRSLPIDVISSSKYLTINKYGNRFGMAVFSAGMLIYLYFIYKIGGLSYLWNELHSRVEITAGLGYFQQLYSFLLPFGALIVFAVNLSRKKWILSIFLIVATIVILGSLGQRAPVIKFLFALTIVYHYKVNKITSLFGFKTCVIALSLILFMIISVQFRVPGTIERYTNEPSQILSDISKTFESQIIARFGRIERDIVILKYFENNDFWLGGSYYSIITAPIPSSLYSDKPPVDTGRYLVAMANSEIVQPPTSIDNLPKTSWPDGNWAGYMNFYIPGFIVTFFLSGYFFGWLYSYVKRCDYALGPVILYSMLSWGGAISLSPMNIVNLLTLFLFLSLTIFPLRLRI